MPFLVEGPTYSLYVCIVTTRSLSCNSEYNASIRAMILFLDIFALFARECYQPMFV